MAAATAADAPPPGVGILELRASMNSPIGCLDVSDDDESDVVFGDVGVDVGIDVMISIIDGCLD